MRDQRFMMLSAHSKLLEDVDGDSIIVGGLAKGQC